MDEASLVRGFKVFAPEPTKVVALAEAPSNPIRPQPRSLIAFRQVEEITWLREMNAAITYLHGGRVLKQESLHCDYYGFMTAADELFADFEHRKEAYAVTSSSTLEITIRLALEDIPTLGLAREDRGRKLFTPVGDRIYLGEGIPEDADFLAIPWDERVRLESITHSVRDVWSSKRTREQNMAEYERYRIMADTAERIVGAAADLDDDIGDI